MQKSAFINEMLAGVQAGDSEGLLQLLKSKGYDDETS